MAADDSDSKDTKATLGSVHICTVVMPGFSG